MSTTTPIGKPAPLGVRIGGKVQAPKGKAGGVDRDELARIRRGEAPNAQPAAGKYRPVPQPPLRKLY